MDINYIYLAVLQECLHIHKQLAGRRQYPKKNQQPALLILWSVPSQEPKENNNITFNSRNWHHVNFHRNSATKINYQIKELLIYSCPQTSVYQLQEVFKIFITKSQTPDSNGVQKASILVIFNINSGYIKTLLYFTRSTNVFNLDPNLTPIDQFLHSPTKCPDIIIINIVAILLKQLHKYRTVNKDFYHSKILKN